MCDATLLIVEQEAEKIGAIVPYARCCCLAVVGTGDAGGAKCGAGGVKYPKIEDGGNGVSESVFYPIHAYQ